MFFPRRAFHEMIEVVGTLSIAACVFVLLSLHIPFWAAAAVALTAFIASFWAGL